MKYVTPYIQSLAGLLCLSFALALPASALESGAYLSASVSQASSIESLDTSLELKADATTSREAENEEHETNVQAASSVDTHEEQPSNSQRGWWSLFQSKASGTASGNSHVSFWASLASMLHLSSSRASTSTQEGSSAQALAYVRVQDVGATQATVSWSPSKLKIVSVYYATSTPVLVATSTAHVSPWKFWSHESVTLRGLAPDTTYFYKVVADTDLGTTTTAEASFRTLFK